MNKEQDTKEVLSRLLRKLEINDDSSSLWEKTYSLIKLIESEKLSSEQYKNIIQALKPCYDDSYCYEVIWHCVQTLPYPEFYQAWHSQC